MTSDVYVRGPFYERVCPRCSFIQRGSKPALPPCPACGYPRAFTSHWVGTTTTPLNDLIRFDEQDDGSMRIEPR